MNPSTNSATPSESVTPPLTDSSSAITSADNITSADHNEPSSGHRWWVPVVPLAVYLLCGMFEPTRTPASLTEGAGHWERLTTMVTFSFDWFPAYYFFRIAITLAAILFVIPGIRRGVAGDWGKWRWSFSSIGLGILATVLWIFLCGIPWNAWLVSVSGYIGESVSASVASFFGDVSRTGFNPYRDMPAFSGPLWLTLFLSVRFTGLALIVPIVEELFLRGFLIRFIQRDRWWEVPIGVVTRGAIVAMLVYAVATHPSEWAAAIAWFSLVTWWSHRTGSLWTCVQVHMATNLCLGIYIVATQSWDLW